MKKPDGGPAFPSLGNVVGITLRDYFAGKALQGFLSNPSEIMLNVAEKSAKLRKETTTAQTYSRWAYEQADSMLSEREKE